MLQSMESMIRLVDDSNTEGNLEIESVFIKQEQHDEEQNNENKYDGFALDVKVERTLSFDDSQPQLSNGGNINSWECKNIKPKIEDLSNNLIQTKYIDQSLTMTIQENVKTVENDVSDSKESKQSVLTATATGRTQINNEMRCTQCSKRFNTRSDLSTHLLIHSGVIRHKCQQCEKEFSHASSLKTHLVIHSGVKAHQCKYCKRKFSLAGHLKNHLLTHSDVKPYKCEHCKKEFIRESHLKTHLLTHSGVTPYQCEHCQKGFNRVDNLKTHLLTHSDAKPHKCHRCQREFSRASYLKTHLLIHNDIKPFQCEHCKKEFNRAASLKSHLVAHRTDFL